MAKEIASPAYLWYPKDVFSSGRIDELSAAEECWYRRALDRSWMDNGVPADAVKCAAHIGKKCTVKAAEKILAMFFVPSKRDPSRMVNKRQEAERLKWKKTLQERSRAGVISGQKRRQKKQAVAEAEQIQQLSDEQTFDFVQTKREQKRTIPIPIPIPKDLREEGEGETPPLARPPADLKFEDSAFDHPAVVVYQERFQVKVRNNFAKAVAERVKDLGVWNALIADKIAWADEPLEKRQNVAKWILKAYDERVEEKKSGNGKGKGFASQGVTQAQPYNEIEFQKLLRTQQEAD